MLKLVSGERTQSPWDLAAPQEINRDCDEQSSPCLGPSLSLQPCLSWQPDRGLVASTSTPDDLCILSSKLFNSICLSSLLTGLWKNSHPKTHTTQITGYIFQGCTTKQAPSYNGLEMTLLNFQNKIVRKWIFLEKKPAKGKSSSFPPYHPTVLSREACNMYESQRDWLLLATGGQSGIPRPRGIQFVWPVFFFFFFFFFNQKQDPS